MRSITARLRRANVGRSLPTSDAVQPPPPWPNGEFVGGGFHGCVDGEGQGPRPSERVD